MAFVGHGVVAMLDHPAFGEAVRGGRVHQAVVKSHGNNCIAVGGELFQHFSYKWP